MELILWRHAEAEPKSANGTDEARELTPKGRKQAKRAAAWLTARLKGRYVLLSSPAARTRQTALALTGDVRLVDELGPESTATRILQAAGWPTAGGTIIVVGHRPGLNRTASLLMTGREREWEMKKGGLWWFQAREDGEPAFLRAVAGPKDL